MQLTDINIKLVPAEAGPNLRDNRDAWLLDNWMLSTIGERFMRYCSSFELRPGEMETLQKGGNSVVLCVEETETGLLQKEVFVCSKQMTLERRLGNPSIGLIGQRINKYGELNTVYHSEGKILHHTNIPLFIWKV